MTAFCRCCCSGIISEPTVMPVRSSNSLWYLVRRSPRGLFTRKTSIFSPLKRFQSNAPCACAASWPAPGTTPSAAAPTPACNRRRRCSCDLCETIVICHGFLRCERSPWMPAAGAAVAGASLRRMQAPEAGIILHERPPMPAGVNRRVRVGADRQAGASERIEERFARAVGEVDERRANGKPAGIAGTRRQRSP